MSHFTVLVVGDNVAEQLQPYHEYECTGVMDQYVVFVDHTEEVTKEFNDPENTETRIKLPSGKLVSPYDEMFYRPATQAELDKIGTPIGSGIAHGIIFHTEYGPGRERNVKVKDTTGMEEVEVPVSEIYDDVYAYAKETHGYEKHEDDDRIGDVTNPNAKWDWWVVGGRWTGFFKPRNGAEAVLGQSGAFGNQPKEGYADQLRKGDIDFEGMREDARQKAADKYHEFHMATLGIDPPERTWAELREQYKDDIDQAREIHNNHPWIAALRKANLDPMFDCTHDYYCVRRGGRDQFIQDAADRVGVTFAVLKDGQWYERGSMGWWGAVADEDDQATWNSKFQELFDSIPDDTMLTVVGCHI
jgi:hypothetical protein